MKNRIKKFISPLWIAATLSVAPSVVVAQYQEIKEANHLANVPLETFAASQRVLFNFNWKFQLVTEENSKTDFASPDIDDSSWRTLDLPHDFQFEQPWDESIGGARGFKPMCEGWYRKTFAADSLWLGKRLLLDIGGIIYLGDVYFNGHKIASTEYGYVGLEANLTPYLRFDEPNTIAIYASTGPKKGSRWYTGGGLFRDVYLRLENTTHIARNGVFISTPEVSANRATVAVQVEVAGWQKHDVQIKTKIRDANGEVVGFTSGKMPEHTKQQSTEVMLPEVPLSDPNLWSCKMPYLYTAEVCIWADGILVDSLNETFGIRKLEFSPEFGFKLNGEKLFLQGNANHHDLGALGAASNDRAIERMMLQLKSFGYNTIRCSHNPYSESFARIADRVGMLIVDEFIDKWSDKDYWGGREPFTNIWYKLIPEWVKRDRNRPSVILWSLGNELQLRNDWAGFDGTNDWGVTSYRIMDVLVKRFDSTRMTTVAMFPSRAGGLRKDKDFDTYLVPPELSCATEVASFNYQSAVYKNYLEYKPDLILFQSEAETNRLLEPYYNMDRNRCVGMAYWGSVEYWGESNKWPKKGWNYSFFDHTMQPYPQAYLIKSAFMPDVPVVHIGVVNAGESESVSWNDVVVGRLSLRENWNCKVNSKQSMFTYTNAASVELLVNGKSYGIQQNDVTDSTRRNMIYWQDVPYSNGGSVEAIARNAEGVEVARHRIETTGKAVALKITAEVPAGFSGVLAKAQNNQMSPWKADGMDLQYLNVTAVDSKGRCVPDFNGELSVSVEGEGQFVALDNHDHYTDFLFRDVTTKPMMNGQMQIIVCSTRKAGDVLVKVAANGLKSTTIKMNTVL